MKLYGQLVMEASVASVVHASVLAPPSTAPVGRAIRGAVAGLPEDLARSHVVGDLVAGTYP